MKIYTGRNLHYLLLITTISKDFNFELLNR